MLDWRARVVWAAFFAVLLIPLTDCGGTGGQALIAPASVVLLPGQTIQFNQVGHKVGERRVWVVNGVAGGSASTGIIDNEGNYTAPSGPPKQPVMVSVDAPAVASTVSVIDPNNWGSIANTQNPLVAAYSISAPVGSSLHVQFGLDTTYGLSTSSIQAPTYGGSVTILVAGMRAGTTYHMQAVVDTVSGSHAVDTDHVFTTGTIPAERIPNITAQQFGLGSPSDGVELFCFFPYGRGDLLSTVATDLEGNVIWYYDLESADTCFPIKPLPNGHMLVTAFPFQGSALYEIREIDLAGNIINRLSITDINRAISAVASFQVSSLHHDFAILPNGHLILIAQYVQVINNVPGIPPGTAMSGDALIDWDPKYGPAWTWSAFDHLDLTHAPYGFADWTHANAIVYSPDDGNLLLSMRNQNWIIKIDYHNGTGNGSVLWRLGPDGDFTLPGQEAPIEWNYGQHYPTIVSPNSAGVFSLMFFNNGNNRLMDSNNDVCGIPGVGPCYSSVPIFQIDEFAKTATVLSEDDLLPSYSICCGDSLILPNGNHEFDIAFDQGTPGFSHIEEVTPQTNQLVWKMDIEGQLAYRGFRIPSLYPGQVWSAAAQASPHRVLRPPAKPARPLPRTIWELP